MGLFDFLKKKKTDLSPITDRSISPNHPDSSYTFKGDLAFVNKSDAVSNPKPENHPAEDKDSEDSFVFMTFASDESGSWICSECETINKKDSDGCVVCGLKR